MDGGQEENSEGPGVLSPQPLLGGWRSPEDTPCLGLGTEQTFL